MGAGAPSGAVTAVASMKFSWSQLASRSGQRGAGFTLFCGQRVKDGAGNEFFTFSFRLCIDIDSIDKMRFPGMADELLPVKDVDRDQTGCWPVARLQRCATRTPHLGPYCTGRVCDLLSGG